jgi:GNAT superfamily N-acetyltransferase
MKDYIEPVASAKRGTEPAGCVAVLPCESLEELSEIRGRLRKMDHSPAFLASVFDQRCKQLYPRDLLVAWVTSRRGKSRAVGIIRRTLKFDRQLNCASLYVEFVWVFPECRGQQLGRMLLHAGLVVGKPKDVRLVVAGSVDNLVAIRLYESAGFAWTDSSCCEMLLTAEQAQAAVESYTPPSRTVTGPPSSNASAASEAVTDVTSRDSISDLAFATAICDLASATAIKAVADVASRDSISDLASATALCDLAAATPTKHLCSDAPAAVCDLAAATAILHLNVDAAAAAQRLQQGLSSGDNSCVLNAFT